MTRTILKRVAASALLSAATAPCFLALPAAAQSYTVLHSFDGSDGQTPHGLVQPGGGDRNFYGTTSSGGATNNGTVFMITPGGTLTTLHSFGEIWSDGAHPNAGVVFASDGNFYGTTSDGPSRNLGTVFKITPTGTLTTLYVFAGSRGADPSAGLVQAGDGNFYGTTRSGGASGFGTVFKITPDGGLTTLHSFAGGDGQGPYAGLVQGSAGTFYGTTLGGGASDLGTVFKITPNGTLTTLHSFTGGDGQIPYAGLVQGSEGNFYGTTSSGGTSDLGTVFKITPFGALTTLYSFAGSDGATPTAGLVQGSDGNFYGTTSYGPARNLGTVFKITPDGTLTTLYSFAGSDGEHPTTASLVQGSDGNFYGTTSSGGAFGNGVVFRLTPEAPPSCYSLTTGVSPGGSGAVSVNTGQNCSGGFTAGTNISLTATPQSGWTFAGWSGSGGSFSKSWTNPTTFTITGNASVTAIYGAIAPAVSAFASPTSAGVNVPISFTCLASGGTGTYSYSWSVTDGAIGSGSPYSHAFVAAGSYTATCTARDTGTGLTGAGTATITVSNSPADSTPPTVAITSPTSSTTYSTSSTPIVLGGTASDNVGVTQVTCVNAAAGAPMTASGTTSWYCSVGLASGGNPITVTARDAAGNTSSDTITVTYSPVAPIDHWTATTTIGAPSARDSHTAVWTGSKMIVWGGQSGSGGYLNDGGLYDPVANTWTAITTTGAPSARAGHTAVWTGFRMVVWGGYHGAYLNDGGQYDPITNTWTAITTTGAPSARVSHTAVWTGSRMIVWSGSNGSPSLNDGGQYDPVVNAWTATTSVGAPSARDSHTAVWTGSRMIVWGGVGAISGYLNDGGQYDPVANAWTATTTAGAPSARGNHTAVWTGSRMIVWGGSGGSGISNDGGQYDPVANAWTPTTTTSAPSIRSFHTAVWTGSRMIVWGGTNGRAALNDGGQYDPAANTWTAAMTTGAPSARWNHTAVWTGSAMIVWGGGGYSGRLNDGGQCGLAPDTAGSAGFLPVGLDNGAGLGGSHYTTELTLASKASTAIQVALVYNASVGSGTGTVSITLGPGETRIIPNTISFLRSQGLSIPTSGDVIGTLLATFDSSSSDPFIGGRTFTTGGGGTVRLFYPARAPTHTPQTLAGLQQNSAQRSNVALANAGGTPITLSVQLFGPLGEDLGTLPDQNVPPYGWAQINQPLEGKAASGRAVVTETSASSPFTAYGALNDAVTSHGSFPPPLNASAAVPGDRLVPIVLDIYGLGGSHYTTELTLANLTPSSLPVTLVYTASLGSGSGQTMLTLAPGEQRIVPNAIGFLRSQGLAIPNDGSSVGGSLLALPPSGTQPSAFSVGARTFTPASSGGGTFGVYSPGLTLGVSATSVAYINGLQQNSSQRSNLAVVNRGDASDAITLNVSYFDGTGAALGTPTAVTLASGQWMQFNQPLQTLGATWGYAMIQKTSGNSSFVAYGVLNDAVTSDGSYIPMSF